jgi:hypothetical protein
MGEGHPRSERHGEAQGAEDGPDGAGVAAYLTAHPDFLVEHPELLATLTPPEHRLGSNVVDLQHFMLHRLRDENVRLKAQQRLLISTSRSNLSSQQRIHEAVLAVIGAGSFEGLIQIVTTDLAVLLDVDVVTLCVEGSGRRPAQSGLLLLPPGMVDSRLGRARDARLAEHVRGDPTIFGDGAGLVRSEALLRLPVGGAPPGLLALGSRKATKFRPGHGTELLSFLARSLGVTIAQWLDL